MEITFTLSPAPYYAEDIYTETVQQEEAEAKLTHYLAHNIIVIKVEKTA